MDSAGAAAAPDASSTEFSVVQAAPADPVTVTADFSDAELRALMTPRFTFWENEDWDWYVDNIPFVETPDARLDEVYYYRWQLLTTHLRYASPQVGYVATEFNDSPGYAGAFGAIVAPSGHQLYEMQWLRDRRFAEDYLEFYFNQHSSKPYSYSSWLADNAWTLNKVHRNDAYATELLPELVKYYEHYEEMQFNPALGLFWSVPVWDAMEHTVSSKRAISSYHGGDGYRPTLNSYMYANALAIQAIAQKVGDSALAAGYGRKAAALRTNVQNRLWDDDRDFFLHMYRLNEKDGIRAETLIDDTGLYTGDKKGREQIGFIPWAFNLPEDQPGDGYEEAWTYLTDANYFQARYGPRTAEHSDHRYSVPGPCCHWSGRSWPYATTQTLKGMANALQNYTQTHIDKTDYIDTLNTYVDVHMAGSGNQRPYIAEAIHPDNGSWSGHNRRDHSEHYFHSGYVDLIITGLMGLQPQSDDTLVLKPLVPATWGYFLLDNLRYHGHDITILWDRDGTKYQRGSGYQVFVDNTRVHHSDTVSASVTINVGAAVHIPRDNLVNYAVNNTADTYPQASASYSFRADPPSEAINGKYYYTDVPFDRWTTWTQSAAQQTFSVNFGQNRPIHTVKLFLYDDGGGVRTPTSYTIQYWNGTAWTDVTETSRSPQNPTGNRANTVEFTQVSTSRIRAVLNHTGQVAVGMTEFEAWGPAQPIAGPPPSDNLVLNADAWKYPRIYPSFAFIDRPVFRAHDGNSNTYWSTQESRNGTNEFLRVDFGEQVTAKTVVVHFRTAPLSMSLQYRDGGTWTAIPNVLMSPATPANNTTTRATFPAVTTDQIRINFTTRGQTDSNGYAASNTIIRVNEVEIYEDGPGVRVTEGDLTVDEGATVTYSMVLTSEPTADVTVAISDPTDSTTVTASPASLTFTSSTWQQEQTVMVNTSPDGSEGDVTATITHTVTSTDANYNGLTVEDVTVTVADMNDPPEFADANGDGVADPVVRAITENAASGRLGAAITATDPENDTLTYSVAATSDPDADAHLAAFNRDFSLDSASGQITVKRTAAIDYETRSSYKVTYRVSDNKNISGVADTADTAVDDSLTLTIIVADENDHDDVTVTGTSLAIDEGGEETYNVVLTTQPAANVRVTMYLPAGNSTVRVSPGSLTFTRSDWNQPQTVTVTAPQDGGYLDDTATITHTTRSTDPNYNAIEVEDVTVTVTDDDVPSPQWEAELTAGQVGGHVPPLSGYSITVDVGATLEPSSVVMNGNTYNVVLLAHDSYGLHLAFDRVPPSDFVFEIGDGTYRGRDSADPGLNFAESFYWPTPTAHWTVGQPVDASLAFTGNPLPANRPESPLTASFPSFPASHNGSGTLTFRLSLSDNTTATASSIMEALTVQGATLVSVTEVGTAGKFWNVKVRPSSRVDISVTLSPPTDCAASDAVCTPDGRILSAAATLVIEAVLIPVTATFAQTSYSVDEGSTVEVTVTLSADPERDVEVPLTAANQDGASDRDYSGVPASVTFSSGETSASFTIRAIDDSTDDDGESIRVGIGGDLPAAVTAGTISESTVLIVDDDLPPPEWAAMLIAGQTSDQAYTGYSTAVDVGATLAPSSFVVDGDTYNVELLGHDGSGLLLGLDAIPPNDFLLTIGDATYPQSDSTDPGLNYAASFYWANPTADWTVGQIVFVSLRFGVTTDVRPANAAPVFPDSDGDGAADPVTRRVAENTTAGDVGAAITATDVDGDVLTYSVAATTDTDAAAHLAAFNRDFSLDTATGQISVKATAAIDHETRTSYKVTYQVTDNKNTTGGADTTIDDTLVLSIDVTDVTNEAGGDADTREADTGTVPVENEAPAVTGRSLTARFEQVPASHDGTSRRSGSSCTSARKST